MPGESKHAEGHADAEEAMRELYGAPLEEFVALRTRLARELKRSGQDAAGKLVAKAPKPSVAAWAINRLWRTSRRDFERLVEDARRVREGADATAVATHRAHLHDLTDAGARILAAGGHTATDKTLQRIKMTLQALAATGSFAPDQEGCLIGDRDPPGFDAMVGFVAKERPQHFVAKERPQHFGTAHAEAKRERARDASDALREAHRAEAMKKEAAERARREAARKAHEEKIEEARHALARAKERADAARRKARELDTQWAELQRQRERLMTEAANAEQEVEQAKGSLESLMRARPTA